MPLPLRERLVRPAKGMGYFFGFSLLVGAFGVSFFSGALPPPEPHFDIAVSSSHAKSGPE